MEWNETTPVEYQYAEWVGLYIPPVMLVFGTLGNILSGITWIRICRHEPVSTYVYLSVLSGADTVALFVGLFRDWLQLYFGLNVTSLSQWSCRLFMVSGFVFTDYSVWLIVAVTAERFLAVYHPIDKFRTNRIGRAVGITVLLFCVIVGINSHLIQTASITDPDTFDNFTDPCLGGSWKETLPQCGASPGYEVLVEVIWPYVDLCLYSILPFILLLTLNCLIIRIVSMAAVLRNQPDQDDLDLYYHRHHHHHHPIRHSPGERKITAMLLTISFTFLLTTLPMNVVVILNVYWNSKLPGLDCYLRNRILAKMRLANTVSRILMYTNHSINFWLYCATGRKFRTNMCCMLGIQTGAEAHEEALGRNGHVPAALVEGKGPSPAHEYMPLQHRRKL